MRYRISLVGNPKMDLVLRAKYIAAFGDACYVSEGKTFDCWYKTWEKACEDAALIGEVSGNAPYDKGYKCQPVGNGDYTLQIGSDVANITRIYFEGALRQTPLVEIDGVPTEVSGPYRNLTEPQKLAPGARLLLQHRRQKRRHDQAEGPDPPGQPRRARRRDPLRSRGLHVALCG